MHDRPAEQANRQQTEQVNIYRVDRVNNCRLVGLNDFPTTCTIRMT